MEAQHHHQAGARGDPAYTSTTLCGLVCRMGVGSLSTFEW